MRDKNGLPGIKNRITGAKYSTMSDQQAAIDLNNKEIVKMPDYSVLKTKLADPTIAILADDTARSVELNTPNIPVKKPIIVVEIEKYLAATHKYIPIIDSADTNAREAVLALQKFNSFDTENPVYLATLTSILDGLVTIALLNTADKDYILGMADTAISWADNNWSGEVKDGDVQAARMQ